ncbi:MAG: hypothetical protein ACKOXO_09570 [Cyanobium sp.]
MSCPNCGSWAVKSDRSLGGRMICGRCGQPLGAGHRIGTLLPLRRRRSRIRRLSRPGRWLWWLGLATLVGSSALLASLGPTQPLPKLRPLLEHRQGARVS